MSQSDSDQVASSSPFWLILASACAFLIGFDSLVVSPLVPVITAAAGVNIGSGGLMVTTYALAYMVCSPFLGPLSDRFGRKWLIVSGLVVFGGATAAISTTTNFPLILTLRAISGFGASLIMPSVFALVAERSSPQKRGKSIGLVVASLMGASVAGVPIGAFIAQASSWQFTFAAIAGLTGLVLVGVLFGLRETASPVPTQSRGGARGYFASFSVLRSDRSVGFTLLATLLWSLGLQTTFANAGLFYSTNFGLNTAQVGIAILGGGAASVCGNLLGGRLSDSLGRRRVVSFSAVIASLAVVVFSLMTMNLWLAIAAQIVWGAGVGLGQSSLTTLQSELSPKARGTVMALNASALYAGSTLGTISASGLLVRHVPFFAVGLISGVATFLVVIVVSAFVRETGLAGAET